MLASEFFKQWYKHFAVGVDPKFMKDHVYSKGNYPWHIFSFEKVKVVAGGEAYSRFLSLFEDSECYYLEGFDFENGVVEKVKDRQEVIALMEEGYEVYVTEVNFKWTFVWTHESYWCGPYLAFKK